MKYLYYIFAIITTIVITFYIINQTSPIKVVEKYLKAEENVDKVQMKKYLYKYKAFKNKKNFDKYIEFLSFMKADKKFTSKLNISKYKKQEYINDNSAEVIFFNKKQTIFYKLKKIHNKWRIVKFYVIHNK